MNTIQTNDLFSNCNSYCSVIDRKKDHFTKVIAHYALSKKALLTCPAGCADNICKLDCRFIMTFI